MGIANKPVYFLPGEDEEKYQPECIDKSTCFDREVDNYAYSLDLQLCAQCTNPLMFYEENCKKPCGDNLYLLSDIANNIHLCVEKCPKDFYEYVEHRLCVLCRWSPDLNLVMMEDGSCRNFPCLPTSGYFRDAGKNICYKCHEDCLECNGPNDYQCTKCKEGNGLTLIDDVKGSRCKICSHECDGCQPHYYKDCQLCVEPYKLIEKKIIIEQSSSGNNERAKVINECIIAKSCQEVEILRYKPGDDNNGSYECEQCSMAVDDYGNKIYPNCLTCNTTSC